MWHFCYNVTFFTKQTSYCTKQSTKATRQDKPASNIEYENSFLTNIVETNLNNVNIYPAFITANKEFDEVHN